jgi:hypothetical protein
VPTTDRVVSLPVVIDGAPDDLIVPLGLIRSIRLHLGRVELVTSDSQVYPLRVSTVAEALSLLDQGGNDGVWTRGAWLMAGVVLAVAWDWWAPFVDHLVNPALLAY